jgi:hypothetical protein
MEIFLKVSPVRLWQAKMIELYAKEAYWRKLDEQFPDGEEKLESVVEQVRDVPEFLRVLARVLDENLGKPRFSWDVWS